MLEINNLTKIYPGGHKAVDDVLQILKQEFILLSLTDQNYLPEHITVNLQAQIQLK